MRIFQNKFKPINLYHLCYMRGLWFETMHDKDCIGVKVGIFKLRKTSQTYKEFGKLFYKI